MKIAVFGHSLFHLAIGLQHNPANQIRFFLDSGTIPVTLRDEERLNDRSLVKFVPRITYQDLLYPKNANITEQLRSCDVALVTDLGPVFATSAGIKYIFIPGGSDLTEYPFPVRSRSTRQRGREDVLRLLIAARLRPAIRSAMGIWGSGPFSPWVLAATRLGLSLDGFLPRAFDTELFAPEVNRSRAFNASESLTIFHPTRIDFSENQHTLETGGCKRNDLLFRGAAEAIRSGLRLRLVLIEREGSPDQERAKQLLSSLGVTEYVTWLNPRDQDGYSWRETADLYRTSDVVVSDFAGWTGMVNVEGAACGKPVIGYLEPDAMNRMYPDGNPLVQAASSAEVCDSIMMLADSERRDDIGRRSREWALEHHDMYVVARRCESMLRTLGVSD